MKEEIIIEIEKYLDSKDNEIMLKKNLCLEENIQV